MPERQCVVEFQVRDYECDMQGVVNNAVYQNYLEHARHEFLKSKGIDFAEMTKEGVNLVVIRAELDYRSPLKSGDPFHVVTRMEQVSALRFAFLQKIVKIPGGEAVMDAKIIGTAVNRDGRPKMPKAVRDLLIT